MKTFSVFKSWALCANFFLQKKMRKKNFHYSNCIRRRIRLSLFLFVVCFLPLLWLALSVFVCCWFCFSEDICECIYIIDEFVCCYLSLLLKRGGNWRRNWVMVGAKAMFRRETIPSIFTPCIFTHFNNSYLVLFLLMLFICCF